MNPFYLGPYKNPETFCDRLEETKEIISALESGRHVTLFAPRRVGKTGLIKHVQHKMCHKNKKRIAVLIDAYNTDSDASFTAKFISMVLTAINNHEKGITKRLGTIFGRYGFGFTVNPLTGQTEVEIKVKDQEASRTSLQSLLELMKSSKHHFVIGVDEFQQIATYDKTLVDASLREFLQNLPNASFIFSGSQRHMLYGLFSDTKRPLFRSTEYMQLEKISYPAYTAFIKKSFQKAGKEISDVHIHDLLEWTDIYTYYTQYFCNRLFDEVEKKSTDANLFKTKQYILSQQEPPFQIIKRLLSHHQWKLLRAIALAGEVSQPTSHDFRVTYSLGGASTILNALEALVDKELIYERLGKEKSTYIVYDVFLKHWIRQSYPLE